jgi:hypothetical protein
MLLKWRRALKQGGGEAVRRKSRAEKGVEWSGAAAVEWVKDGK